MYKAKDAKDQSRPIKIGDTVRLNSNTTVLTVIGTNNLGGFFNCCWMTKDIYKQESSFPRDALTIVDVIEVDE